MYGSHEFISGGEAQYELAPVESAVAMVSSSSSSAGSSSSPSPLAIQRSISSHSLQRSGTHRVLSSVFELLDSEAGPVRRVYSTGDLHERINMGHHGGRYRSESPLSSESNAIIEGMMSKACRYSPEEKKERIERYRTKRNLRNFNKKIKYACRKTLADSRPRIRGRFARNEEIDKSSSELLAQWNHVNGGEEYYDEEDENNWISFLDTFSSSNLFP